MLSKTGSVLAFFSLFLVFSIFMSEQARSSGLEANCLQSSGTSQVSCDKTTHSPSGLSHPSLFNPTSDAFAPYVLYRTLTLGSTERRCRLHPTCSLFAMQAIQRYGLLQGALMGMARAQMQHDDHFGLLDSSVDADGLLIHDDPVSNWGPHSWNHFSKN